MSKRILETDEATGFKYYTAQIPTEKVKPYPGLPLRFDMDLDGMIESIHKNGQEIPASAVEGPDGTVYLYDGRRRYHAVLACAKKWGAPRTIWAKVYEQLPDEAMLVKALVTNESGRNERKDLSLLEEVDFFDFVVKKVGKTQAAEIGIRGGKQPDYMRRLLEVSLWITPMLKKLHEVETKSGFRFRLAHLESLAIHSGDPRTFYSIAAIAAERGLNPSEVEVNGLDEQLRYFVKWFYGAFPEFKQVSGDGLHDEPEEGIVESVAGSLAAMTARGADGPPGAREGTAKDGSKEAAPSRVLHVEADVYFGECPSCEFRNPFKFDWKDGQVTFISIKEDGQPAKQTVVPNSIYEAEHTCTKCGEAFTILIQPEGKSTLRIDCVRKANLPEPGNPVSTSVLCYDPKYARAGREQDGWLVVTADRKVRLVDGRPVT